MRILTLFTALALLVTTSAAAATDTSPVRQLTIHDHAFSPATLTVPANQRVKIQVKNARALPSEFESYDLNREKVVPGGSTVDVWIGPLKPGKYKFFDDFNSGVTGHIVVEPAGRAKS